MGLGAGKKKFTIRILCVHNFLSVCFMFRFFFLSFSLSLACSYREWTILKCIAFFFPFFSSHSFVVITRSLCHCGFQVLTLSLFMFVFLLCVFAHDFFSPFFLSLSMLWRVLYYLFFVLSLRVCATIFFRWTSGCDAKRLRQQQHQSIYFIVHFITITFNSIFEPDTEYMHSVPCDFIASKRRHQWNIASIPVEF